MNAEAIWETAKKTFSSVKNWEIGTYEISQRSLNFLRHKIDLFVTNNKVKALVFCRPSQGLTIEIPARYIGLNMSRSGLAFEYVQSNGLHGS